MYWDEYVQRLLCPVGHVHHSCLSQGIMQCQFIICTSARAAAAVVNISEEEAIAVTVVSWKCARSVRVEEKMGVI